MRGAQNDANSEEAFGIAEFSGSVYSREPARGDSAASKFEFRVGSRQLGHNVF